MSCFDQSKITSYKNPPTETYRSYMCPTKCEYQNQSVQNTVVKHPKFTQTNIVQDKNFQKNIAKLRDILSDTISNLTRENNLEKGESVELTLEIELINSLENSPANSLVEVTIIQHNKDGSSKINQTQDRMLFKIDDDNSTKKESAPQKHQSWFRKVTSKEYIMNKSSIGNKEGGGENMLKIKTKQLHKPLFCPVASKKFEDLNNTGIQNAKGNLENIKPGETIDQNMKNYQKSSKTESSGKPKAVYRTKEVLNTQEKLNKPNYIVNKISSIFLSSKPSKSEVVEKNVRMLQNEIGKMKIATNNKKYNKKKTDEIPTVKLGKMVNNILFDVMESKDGEEKNNTELSLPLNYQSFFEPAKKMNKKEKKSTKKKTKLSINKLYRSHSDTCCVRPLRSEMEVKVKSSNSISECTSCMDRTTPSRDECAGDTKQRKKKRKKSKYREYSQYCTMNVKADGKETIGKDYPTNIPHKRTIFSKTSLIQWNGRNVKVSKDLKTRIEMLIVNELENVPLKEGMHCDIVSLSSTDETWKSSDTGDKMSSFVCELDISDRNVKKILKRKKSLHSKVSIHSQEIIKFEGYDCVDSRRVGTIASIGTQTLPIVRKLTSKYCKDTNEDQIVEKEVQILQRTDNRSLIPDPSNVKWNNVEIKYMNKNTKNWDTESQTVNVYTFNTIGNRQNKLTEDIDHSKNQNNRFTSTGFIKVIKSDDSTWKKTNTQGRIQTFSQEWLETSQNFTDSSITRKSSSKTSTDLEKTIEIELDIKDLERILNEAKQQNNVDKVLIEAKCASPLQKLKCVRPVGKNRPSYTNLLLTNAAKKLEKLTKMKRKSKKSYK